MAFRWPCRHQNANEATKDIICTKQQSSMPPSAKIDNENSASLGLLTHNNIEIVKRINRGSFPLNYGDKFYSMIVDNRELSRLAFVCDIPVGAVCCRLVMNEVEEDVSNLAEDIIPHEVTTTTNSITLTPPKIQQWELTTSSIIALNNKQSKIKPPRLKMCILTLAVLAAYRQSGIGKLLLNWVISRCEDLRRGLADTAIGIIPGLPVNYCGPVNVEEIYLHVWSANKSAINFYESMGFHQSNRIEDYYPSLTPSDCIVFRKTFTNTEVTR